MNLQNPHPHGERASRSDRRATTIELDPPSASGDSAEPTKHGDGMRQRLDALAGDAPLLRVDGLIAGYGSTEILHGIDLRLGAGQIAVPDRAHRRRQVHHPAFDLRPRGHSRRPHRGRRAQRDAARPERQAPGRRHRLRAAGQLGVSRHDGRAEPVARRPSDGRSRRREAGDRAGLRALPVARPPARRARARALGRRAAVARALARARHATAAAPGRRAVASVSSPPSSTAYSTCCATCATARACRS